MYRIDARFRRRVVPDMSKKRFYRRVGAFDLDTQSAPLIANESDQSQTLYRRLHERAKSDPLDVSHNQHDAPGRLRRLFKGLGRYNATPSR